jgi:hypothetical protein
MRIKSVILALVAGLVLVIVLVASAVVAATTLGAPGFEMGIPLGGGHRLMAMHIPCSPTHAGRLIVGRDLFLSSRRIPPGLNIPVTAPCP